MFQNLRKTDKGITGRIENELTPAGRIAGTPYVIRNSMILPCESLTGRPILLMYSLL